MATRHPLPDEALDRSARRAGWVWTFVVILVAAASAGWAVHAYGSSFERTTRDLERRVGDTEARLQWLTVGVWKLLETGGITDVPPPP